MEYRLLVIDDGITPKYYPQAKEDSTGWKYIYKTLAGRLSLGNTPDEFTDQALAEAQVTDYDNQMIADEGKEIITIAVIL